MIKEERLHFLKLSAQPWCLSCDEVDPTLSSEATWFLDQKKKNHYFSKIFFLINLQLYDLRNIRVVFMYISD